MKKFLLLPLFIFMYFGLSAQIAPPGSRDASFNPVPNGPGNISFIEDMEIQSDGKILVNYFEENTNEYFVARLLPGGGLDPSFNNHDRSLFNGFVDVIELQGDKIILGGRFSTIQTDTYRRIARFNNDGSIDNTFNVSGSGFDARVSALHVQSDQKILAGGEFTSYNGNSNNRIIRLNADGTEDPGFDPGSGIDAGINAIQSFPDGKIIIAGQFSTFNSAAVSRIARLNADGSRDGTFNPPVIDGTVFNFALQADGKIIIGGAFTFVGSVSRNSIARLNADGSLDTSFDPGTGCDDWVYSVRVEPSGKIMIGGWFEDYNGTPQNFLVRLRPDGSRDSFFDVGVGPNSLVAVVRPFTTDKVYVAGYFDQWDGALHNAVAVVNNACITDPLGIGNTSCNDAITISASGGSNGQYRWYTQSSGGTPIAGEINSTLSLTGLTNTTTYYVALNDGLCESNRIAVIATISLPPPPAVSPASRCGAGPVTLTATGGVDGEYRWYTQASGGTAIAGETNGSLALPSVAVTTTYYVSINSGSCESARTSVDAIITTVPPPDVTPSSRCDTGPITVNANGATDGQYRWYLQPSGGTAITGETSSSLTIASLANTTIYHVSINDGICESLRVPVTAFIVIVTPPGVTSASRCGPGSLSLGAAGGNVGQYRWYTSSSGGTAISGETNNSFTTPSISSTTTYYVAINDGTCESARIDVDAVVNPVPSAPTTANVSTCINTSAVVTASGGTDGNYRWYDTASGGTAIAGEVNSSFQTPPLAGNATYFVSIVSGTCESSRTSAVVTVLPCTVNEPPRIEDATLTTQIGGSVVLDLLALISDADNNFDPASLRIVVQPQSGATASIDAGGNLTLDYSGLNFAGTDFITIEACDDIPACTQYQFAIEVIGDIVVYNAFSPNGDGSNETFFIQHIDLLSETRSNKVTIFNRWGDVVFKISDYDNVNRVFKGVSNDGRELPSATYFYKIEFPARKEVHGYLSMKK
jgi:gliding motility-associated-like protein/uncharacterized delta-60 repeat protein